MSKKPGASIKVDSEHTNKRRRKLQQMRSTGLCLDTGLRGLVKSLSKDPSCFMAPPKPERCVVYTVKQRRYWLHNLREESQQDSWLLDYTIRDPELTLNWGLLDDFLIEGEDET